MSLQDDLDQALDLSNRIAVLLRDADIPPSEESTAALMLLAAANSLYARTRPMPPEKFLQLAAGAYSIASASRHAYVPEKGPKQ
jgi:hypothetical protein